MGLFKELRRLPRGHRESLRAQYATDGHPDEVRECGHVTRRDNDEAGDVSA